MALQAQVRPPGFPELGFPGLLSSGTRAQRARPRPLWNQHNCMAYNIFIKAFKTSLRLFQYFVGVRRSAAGRRGPVHGARHRALRLEDLVELVGLPVDREVRAHDLSRVAIHDEVPLPANLSVVALAQALTLKTCH